MHHGIATTLASDFSQAKSQGISQREAPSVKSNKGITSASVLSPPRHRDLFPRKNCYVHWHFVNHSLAPCACGQIIARRRRPLPMEKPEMPAFVAHSLSATQFQTTSSILSWQSDKVLASSGSLGQHRIGSCKLTICLQKMQEAHPCYLPVRCANGRENSTAASG